MRRRSSVVMLVLASALLVGSSAARSDVPGTYTVHNLASDVPGMATHLDPDLKNGWGLSAAAASSSRIR